MLDSVLVSWFFSGGRLLVSSFARLNLRASWAAGGPLRASRGSWRISLVLEVGWGRCLLGGDYGILMGSWHSTVHTYHVYFSYEICIHDLALEVW